MIDTDKLNDYLNEFTEDAHPEVRRFIEDLQIKIEFGHFEPENIEYETLDPYA
jgi:hypothetical protein